MTKADILQELPNLKAEERQHILEFLCELQDRDLVAGAQGTPAEKALLDQELEDYRQHPDAGSSWDDVRARLSKRTG